MPDSADSHVHPLYTAAEHLMERGMSHHQMQRLNRLFAKHTLPLPVDLMIAMENAGIKPFTQ